MRRLINDDAIGEVFQYDSFVGGYSEPCTYWHSDAAAEPAVADLPAVLSLYREGNKREVIELDHVEPYSFHASLMGYLMDGAPMEVTTLQSRNVVGIMQAAEESAKRNGQPVVPLLR